MRSIGYRSGTNHAYVLQSIMGKAGFSYTSHNSDRSIVINNNPASDIKTDLPIILKTLESYGFKVSNSTQTAHGQPKYFLKTQENSEWIISVWVRKNQDAIVVAMGE